MIGPARRAVLALAAALLAWGACGRPSELPSLTGEERAAIRKAVEDHLAQRPRLPLWDEGAGRERSVEVHRVGAISVLRSRLFVVEAEGRDPEGRRHPVRFYVRAAGPVFVVDTAILPAPGRPPFAP